MPNFRGGDDFIDRVCKYDDSWHLIHKVKNRDEIWNHIGLDSDFDIYVDSDLYTSCDFIKKNQRGNRLFVYEEGIGTYSGVIKVTKATKWYKIYNILGLLGVFNMVMGEGKKTDGIFLHNKERYLTINRNSKANIIPFPMSFTECYFYNESVIDRIFDLENEKFPINTDVCLFLTSNDLNYDFAKDFLKIKNGSDFSNYIFKPHPQIFNLSNSMLKYMMYNDVISEILILKLLSKNNRITVYHYSCSSELYVSHENLSFFSLEQ
ncbi:hypothetical protein ACE1OE_16735 [Vibrio sp. E150_011]